VRAELRRRREFDRAVYAGRNRVERRVNRLERFRRVATRYEKRACNCLAMVKLAAALIRL
jgi:transposase